MRSATGWKQPFFRLESHRVITELREDGAFVTEATVKVIVGDDRVIATAEGNGPVNALDAALRKAIGPVYPELAHVHLTDFKVRVLDTSHGTGRGHPGADRLHRRRSHLDHHRRVGERHRGVVGGTGGLDRVRVAARRCRGRAASDRTRRAVTQPPHVPLQDTDRVRPSSLLPAPRRLVLERPGELARPEAAAWSPRFGSTGPDLGYGLKLARRLEGRLELAPGRATARTPWPAASPAGPGGRRPSAGRRSSTTWSGPTRCGATSAAAPEDLVDWRAGLFRGAAHDYWVQRRIVDAVRPETLRLTPAQVRARLASWKELLIV